MKALVKNFSSWPIEVSREVKSNLEKHTTYYTDTYSIKSILQLLINYYIISWLRWVHFT